MLCETFEVTSIAELNIYHIEKKRGAETAQPWSRFGKNGTVEPGLELFC